MLQVEKQVTRKFELVTPEYLDQQSCRDLERRRLPDYAPFLDDDGVRNWLALENEGRLHAPTDSTRFLSQTLPYLAEHFVPELNLVSIGVGDGRKERILLESLLRIGYPSYYGIDISSPMIDAALNTVADIPVEKTALVAFFEDLSIINRLCCHPALFCLLGNSISNYGADYVLSAVCGEIGPADLFLFDCHLLAPDPPDIENTFASRVHVRFHVAPLLKRGLDPDAAEFVVRVVDVPTHAGPVQRVDRTLRILRPATITFDHGSVSLVPGDEIRLGRTCQYTLDQVRDCIHHNGLSIVEQHVAPARDVSIFMLRSPRQKPGLL